MGGDEDLGLEAISRPTISFCWLPPDRAWAVTSMFGVRTSKSRGPPRSAPGTLAIEPDAVTRTAAGLVAECDVLPQRRHQQQALALAVLGHVAEPCSRRRRTLQLVTSSPEHLIAPVPHAGADQRVDQLRLTVALHTGDPEDFAAVHLEGTSSTTGRSSSSTDVTSSTSSTTTSVTVDSVVAGVGSSVPTISSARSAAVTSAGFTVATVGPAQHGDRVGDGEHLLELVVDEQDRRAAGLQLAQVAEQLLDLLRHQHRRRLVEDQDLGAR